MLLFRCGSCREELQARGGLLAGCFCERVDHFCAFEDRIAAPGVALHEDAETGEPVHRSSSGTLIDLQKTGTPSSAFM